MVVPLYKCGGQAIMDTYGPINTSSCVQNFWGGCERQLQHYLKQSDLLSPFHHSTLTAVMFFCDSIIRGIDLKKLLGAVFIDLRKSFDSVPNYALIVKSERCSIKTNSLNWFSNYLHNRTKAVSIRNALSNPLTKVACLMGVFSRPYYLGYILIYHLKIS